MSGHDTVQSWSVVTKPVSLPISASMGSGRSVLEYVPAVLGIDGVCAVSQSTVLLAHSPIRLSRPAVHAAQPGLVFDPT
jgi:hypothetical protein